MDTLPAEMLLTVLLHPVLRGHQGLLRQVCRRWRATLAQRGTSLRAIAETVPLLEWAHRAGMRNLRIGRTLARMGSIEGLEWMVATYRRWRLEGGQSLSVMLVARLASAASPERAYCGAVRACRGVYTSLVPGGPSICPLGVVFCVGVCALTSATIAIRKTGLTLQGPARAAYSGS